MLSLSLFCFSDFDALFLSSHAPSLFVETLILSLAKATSLIILQKLLSDGAFSLLFSEPISVTSLHPRIINYCSNLKVLRQLFAISCLVKPVLENLVSKSNGPQVRLYLICKLNFSHMAPIFTSCHFPIFLPLLAI